MILSFDMQADIVGMLPAISIESSVWDTVVSAAWKVMVRKGSHLLLSTAATIFGLRVV